MEKPTSLRNSEQISCNKVVHMLLKPKAVSVLDILAQLQRQAKKKFSNDCFLFHFQICFHRIKSRSSTVERKQECLPQFVNI